MSWVNHYIINRFYREVGGEIYIKYPSDESSVLSGYDTSISGPWIILLDGIFLDDNGVITPQKHGKSVDDPDEHVLEINAKGIAELGLDVKFKKLEKMYYDINKNIYNDILNQIKTLPGVTDIQDFINTGRVYLIKYYGDARILRLFSAGEMMYSGHVEKGLPGSPEYLMRLYMYFSELGITPHVYDAGILHSRAFGGNDQNAEFLYIITDYVPMTIRSIPDINDRKQAVQDAIRLSYYIESLGYYGLDNHGGNYLYDPTTKRVYAIDFAQVSNDPRHKFDGTIRDMK